MTPARFAHMSKRKAQLATMQTRINPKPIRGRMTLAEYVHERTVALDDGGTLKGDALSATITDFYGGYTEYLFMGPTVAYIARELEAQGTCAYCKAEYWYGFSMGDHNHGACPKPRCVLRSMRDHS